jgi:DNA-binding MurR/RpiR family transcriptional regulator
MADDGGIVELVEARFSSLTPQLRKAAQFVVDNPEDIALNSMRSAAARAAVHPNVMLRLARELGFDSYEPFRERFRAWIVTRGTSDWLGRARTLRERKSGSLRAEIIREHVEQELLNLQNTFEPALVDKIVKAASLITNANNVYVLGTRSLFSVAYYFNYVCRLFSTKTILMTGFGGTFADELRSIGDTDAFFALSHQPYARDVVNAVQFAHERGSRIIVVTDSKVAPVITPDSLSIVVSNTSKSLIPTLIPAFAVAEALATFLVAEGTDETMDALARTQSQLTRFGVYFK